MLFPNQQPRASQFASFRCPPLQSLHIFTSLRAIPSPDDGISLQVEV
jgi:hypothetical protein